MIGAALLAAVVSGAVLVPIEQPIALVAPPAVAKEWNSFNDLPASEGGSRAVTTDGTVPAGSGRIDVLRRESQRWVWESRLAYESDVRLAETHYDRGILLRFPGVSSYFWAEARASSTAPIALRPFRNVMFTGADADSSLLLYLPSEDAPRASVEPMMRFVPLEHALACASNVSGSDCAVVPAEAASVSFDDVSGKETRVLRVEPQHDDRYDVLTEGRVRVVAKVVPAPVAQAGPWVAITLDEERLGWDRVVVQRTGGQFATERATTSTLAPIPAFTVLTSRRERGVRFRAFAGKEKRPVADPASRLAVFPQKDGVASTIPLAFIGPDTDGHFDLPSLGAGDYSLKLVSSDVTGELVRVTAMTGVTLDVVFPTGPAVTGRLIRTAGGNANDAATVEVAAAITFMEALRAGDITDRIRAAVADEQGQFRVVMAAPGKYRVSARWGVAAAEREFEITRKMSDVDLGDIVLRTGSTLRGTLQGCVDGTMSLIPTPDLKTSRLSSGIGEIRHATLDAHGQFLIEGLSKGGYGVVAECAKAITPVSPDVIAIPEVGDTVVEFKLAPVP
ncbi:MAG TPA: hypothetical protein VEK79_09575 [Thermoanaerobaculia bacterium]|nr:hypothetical protein [Thermoanaerobaculia bacterium]